MMSRLRALMVALLTVCLAACAHYFKVADPGGGEVFYTEDIKRIGAAVEFKDAQTGRVITMQNSAITQIDKQAYETAIGAANK